MGARECIIVSMFRIRSRHSRVARWATALMALGMGATACRVETRTPGTSASGSSPEKVTIGDVDWYVDYDAALGIAREQDKALWVHFGENPG